MLTGCAWSDKEPTTVFENPKSVFCPVTTKMFQGVVTGYEQHELGLMVLVEEDHTDKVHRVLVNEDSGFGNTSKEMIEAREVGWRIELCCEYNPRYYTDFYPGSHMWVIEETTTDPTA
jgi:hypothetical protein